MHIYEMRFTYVDVELDIRTVFDHLDLGELNKQIILNKQLATIVQFGAFLCI